MWGEIVVKISQSSGGTDYGKTTPKPSTRFEVKVLFFGIGKL
jgi:hypothetical protein